MGRDGKKGKGGGRGSRGADSGSRMFIDNAEELQMREREFNEQRTARLKRRGEEDEATVSKSKAENEEQGEDDAEQGVGAPDSVFTFEKPAKATVSAATEKKEPVGEEEEDEELAGGLLGAYKNRNLHRQDVEADPNNPEAGLSRKQRELLAQQRAKEEYMKRHLAGETEQARRDLERLAVIRAKREEDRKKREAEGRPPGWTAEGIQSSEESSDDGDEVETKPTKSSGASKPAAAAAAAPVSEVTAKKKALAAGEGETTATAADGGPPKLKAMDIKKLSGDQLKEHLKARGLDIQGQKKDLIKRLSDYEASRP